jgi:hypothetical protein
MFYSYHPGLLVHFLFPMSSVRSFNMALSTLVYWSMFYSYHPGLLVHFLFPMSSVRSFNMAPIYPGLLAHVLFLSPWSIGTFLVPYV